MSTSIIPDDRVHIPSAVDAVTDPHNYFTDATIILNGLKGATEHGLEYEFMAEVIKALQSGLDANDAVWAAQCEWDI